MSLRDWLAWLAGTRPPPTRPPVRPPPTPPGDLPSRDELLEAMNDRRMEAGLPPLVTSSRLQAAAQGHADHMAAVGKMAHQGIGDGDLTSRLHSVGYNYLAAGENVAWNQRSVDEVMTSWMGSAGHRAAIMGSYAEVGLGIAPGDRGEVFWCAVFGTPAIPSQVFGTPPPLHVMGTPERTGDYGVAASSVQVLIG